jgi:hypothetical protein
MRVEGKTYDPGCTESRARGRDRSTAILEMSDRETVAAMIEAGEFVLAGLVGQATNELLAREVFLAMARVALGESHPIVLLFERGRW